MLKFGFVMVLVRSGYVNLPGVSGGTLKLTGQLGDYWSSRGTSTRFDGAIASSGYYLNFSAAEVRSSGGPDNRYSALPLRCLSTVLDM